jgi:predicted Ser/Thr protein kinase
MVLKRDVFSTVERGKLRVRDGEVDAVLRRIDEVPWWARAIARHFLVREARALAIAGELGIGPELLVYGRWFLVRRFIDGVALKIAKPTGDRGYFRSARAALRALHRAGVCHNDLAKEQNWLCGADRRAYLLDFQLATRFRRRSRMFRIAAYEDLRHFLKHKRKYAPEALTAIERRVVARKAWHSRFWMATGKRLYLLVTRGLLGFVDSEGSGARFISDAPKIAAALEAQPHVREVVVVPFPDRCARTGLYTFVETDAKIDEAALGTAVAGAVGAAKAPEFLHVVQELPRDGAGNVRAELLQLIATDQVDAIPALVRSEADRTIVDRIVMARKNRYDAPEVTAAFKAHPQVRDVAVVAFPDRLAGVGLYAFVEADAAFTDDAMQGFIVDAVGAAKAPRYLQNVDAFPRDNAGKIRTDMLRLVAMNQVDQIDPLIASDAEREIVNRIVAKRQNFRDRFVL